MAIRPKPIFELFTDYTMEGLRHFWRLRDGDAAVVATSRSYGTRSSALRAAKRHREIAAIATIEGVATSS